MKTHIYVQNRSGIPFYLYKYQNISTEVNIYAL